MSSLDTELLDIKPAYRDGFEHIMDELKRLDILLHLEKCFIVKNSQQLNASLETQQYISDEAVDELLSRDPDGVSEEEIDQHLLQIELLDAGITAKIENTETESVFLPLRYIARLFELNWLEYQLLLLCLAVEIDQKYEKVYAYLQDNITLKRPSLSLLISINSFREINEAMIQGILNETGNLLKYQLVTQLSEDQYSVAILRSRFYRIDKDLMLFLVYGCTPDDIPVAHVELRQVPQVQMPVTKYQQKQRDNILERLTRMTAGGIIHIYGDTGLGKKTLIHSLLQEKSSAYISLNINKLFISAGYERQLHYLIGFAVIHKLPIVLFGLDLAIDGVNVEPALITNLFEIIARHKLLVFSVGKNKLHLDEVPEYGDLLQMPLGYPDYRDQNTLWEHYLNKVNGCKVGKLALNDIARRYQLTPAQIQNAAKLYFLQATTGFNKSLLNQVCIEVSRKIKDDMVTVIKPKYTWDDIVLPENTISLLRLICEQSKNRSKVMQDWGFQEKLHYGYGLSVLFSGPPGTGKTMAAHVMANSLGLECYKIDLSGVVSKYIGETEKNLEKIFNEAQSCNAILFFDEADALFGKRTEVSDAHDRYANLETSYLLQKMEEYNGIAILATNLRSNMDDAFIRRIRFIVDFPFPNELSRQQIWSKARPAKAPVADSVDFDYLAKQLKISGANIKNILLNAAFSAASQGGEITLSTITDSAKLEYQKIGKSWNENIIDHKQG